MPGDDNPMQRHSARQFRLAAWSTLLALAVAALYLFPTGEQPATMAEDTSPPVPHAWNQRLEALSSRIDTLRQDVATQKNLQSPPKPEQLAELREAALAHFGEAAALADELETLPAGTPASASQAKRSALEAQVTALQEAMAETEAAANILTPEQKRARAIAAASYKDYAAGHAIPHHPDSRAGQVWYRAHNGRGVIVVTDPEKSRTEAQPRVYRLPEVW